MGPTPAPVRSGAGCRPGRRRGGAFYIFAANLRCDTEVVAGYFRNFESDSIGFRCCAPSQ